MSTPPTFPLPRNPDDPGAIPVLMGVTWTFTGLALVTVTLRIFIGKKRDRGLGIDDWLMTVAMALQIVSQVLITIACSEGFGKHDADLYLPDQMVQVLKISWIAMTPGILVSLIARVSITILLVRLFGIHTWFRKFLIILTGAQTTIGIVVIICSWLQTKPVEAQWNVFMSNAERWDPRILLYMMYLAQSLWTFADLTYVALPVMFIWKLKMPLHQRISLIFVMALSVVTAAMSIMKTITAQTESGENAEPQYGAAQSGMWSTSEQACVIFLGCIPSLRAASKINFSGLRSFGSSLSKLLKSGASLTKRSPMRSSASYSDENCGSSAAYYDLERNTHELDYMGYPEGRGISKVKTYKSTGSKENVNPESQVRLTNTFTITYAQRTP
ncbi:hypothetical protein F4779DRAFT_600982 [Xylariaceae sp. FL0662B]|nr:hypothetical protein F4779DRAFT_600982 [Xylariaceae sp. FL0662B]